MTLDEKTREAIKGNEIAMGFLRQYYTRALTGAKPAPSAIFPTPTSDLYPELGGENPNLREACELLVEAGLMKRTYNLIPPTGLKESDLCQLAELFGVEEEYEAHLGRERQRMEDVIIDLYKGEFDIGPTPTPTYIPSED